jgi:hypothetical protein
MSLVEEHAYRIRCDDTGEHTSTRVFPRVEEPLGNWTEAYLGQLAPAALAALAEANPGPWQAPPGAGTLCPYCGAGPGQDAGHGPLCPLAEDQAGQLAERLSPDVWRPYLTAAEFAEAFPGVPHVLDLADPAELVALDPEHAEAILAGNAEVRQYLAQRAAAHAATRARLLAAWRQLA